MSPPGQGLFSPGHELQAFQDLQLDGTAHSVQVLLQVPQNLPRELEVNFHWCLTPPLLPRMDNNQGQSRLPHDKFGCRRFADCDLLQTHCFARAVTVTKTKSSATSFVIWRLAPTIPMDTRCRTLCDVIALVEYSVYPVSKAVDEFERTWR